VKTFVVLCDDGASYREFIGNAESPEEAVLYAMARTGMDAEQYAVYDHDLNFFVVPRPTPTPAT
jgi:hypothetical protein